MIGFIRGQVAQILEESVLIDVSGVGYEVFLPTRDLATLEGPGKEILLHTHLIFKEERVSLYGFADRLSLKTFRMLLDVSGVGPKMAMNIMSAVAADRLLTAVASGDHSILQSVHGVGKKTAQRICVDLKDKASGLMEAEGWQDVSPGLAKTDTETEASAMVQDAVAGLVALGYRPKEAMDAVDAALAAMDGQTPADPAEIIKQALRMMSRR